MGAGGEAPPGAPCSQGPLGGVYSEPPPPRAPSPPRPGLGGGPRPVVEVLGAGAAEVAGVLAESWLLGQPGQALDLVRLRRCLARGRPGQLQQQQPQRRQRGSDHLREEVGPTVSEFPRSSSLHCDRSTEEVAPRRREEPPCPRPGPRAHPPRRPGLRVLSSLRSCLTSAPLRPCSPGGARPREVMWSPSHMGAGVT